jgi:hypothetical protein
MKIGVALTTACCLLVCAAVASADFVCAVTREPATANFGSAGAIDLTLNSGPGCTGTQVGVQRFCTSGGTNPGCAAGIFFSDVALAELHVASVHAAAANLPVSGASATCNGGLQGCWGNVSFFATTSSHAPLPSSMVPLLGTVLLAAGAFVVSRRRKTALSIG